jgi:2-polyprenyl-6-methoxyphenol hydroxylase-like FAD-dependent oxidoreductase
MSDRPKALIIGGSVGGLFAARLLQRAGWQATIYERSERDLAGRGAGVGLTRELLDALAAAGAPIDPTIGLAVGSFVWLDHAGKTVFEHPRAMGSSAWVRVFQALRAGFPDQDYHSGRVLADVAQDASSVTATFEDGSRERGDLLVAADGSLSTVRAKLLPDIAPRQAGYVAWRGVVDAVDLPGDARAAIDDHIVFSFRRHASAGGEMMLTMPVPGLTPDDGPGGRYYFIWYRPVADATVMRDLFTDGDGNQHGVSIPPPLIRKDLIDHLRETAAAAFSPAAAVAVHLAPEPLLQAISDMASPRLDHGRIALLGDAAFVARPHVAGGITKAAMDAQALVAALVSSGDMTGGLARYNQSQCALGNGLVDHARYLGSFIAPDGAKNIKPDGAKNIPDEKAIMGDYGAPHLLHDPDQGAFAAPLKETRQ